MVNISGQKTKNEMRFEEESCQSLAYCLETLHCENNRIKNIANFSYFKVLNDLHLRNNLLGDMEEISDPFGAMERLKKMDFRGNPLCNLPKYRDYIVILCKSLE